jgi:hypothetical protein
MFLATVNKPQQLLHLSFIGEVRVEELTRSRDEVAALIAELKPGFRLLTDFGRLDSMGLDCASEIGKVMELCDQKGVELIVRVIPDPTKDIGMGILTLFHYPHRPRSVTSDSMVEAAQLLSL